MTHPGGGETAQELYRQVWHDLVGPVLHGMGFRGGGSRPYFWCPAGDYRGAIGFWKSRHSTREEVDFTASVVALHQPTGTVYWESGLDSLEPRVAVADFREIHAGRPVEPVAEAVLATVRDYAWPAIQAALDSPGYPPEPGRRWPREFPPEPELDDGNFAAASQPRWDDAPGGNPADADFARLASPVAYLRASAAECIGARALDDPRAVPALLSLLEHDRAAGVRRNAAWVLAPAAAESGGVREALRAAAAQDEDIQVRWAARYSLRRADVLQAEAG